MVVEFLAGNRITLLNSGNEYFPALLSAIESAQVEIVNAARRLEQEGKILIARGGSEDALV